MRPYCREIFLIAMEISYREPYVQGEVVERRIH